MPNPLATQSYVDRRVEELREDALASTEEVVRQLRDLHASVSRRIDASVSAAADASDAYAGVADEVSAIREDVASLREQASWTRERVERAKGEDVSSLRALVEELEERVGGIEERARPVIETLGRLGAGGGFFSAKPGKDKVPVGDANGNWELVDKSTLGGGGGGWWPLCVSMDVVSC